MTEEINITENAELELPVGWGWLLALGVIAVIFGMLGIFFAFYLTLASVIVFGVLILLAGGFQLWHGLATKEIKWSGRALHLFVALFYIIFGGLLLWDPISGLIGLTLVLGVFFIAVGLSRIAYAWKCRQRGWRWKLSLFGGIINLLLAGLILYGWPGTSFWVIGLFVAIEMIINGWSLIAASLAARRFHRENNDSSLHKLEKRAS